MIQKSFYLALGAATITLTPLATYAQNSSTFFDTNNTISGTTDLPDTSPVTLALNIVTAFLSIIGILALVLIIYAGFTIMTSQGNQEKVQKGKDILLWSIIGAIIILSSLGIVTFIDSFI